MRMHYMIKKVIRINLSNNYRSQTVYVENNLYKRFDNRTSNNTNNIHKNTNQYSTDVLNSYKTNKKHM